MIPTAKSSTLPCIANLFKMKRSIEIERKDSLHTL
jgi:hypothetical protein